MQKVQMRLKSSSENSQRALIQRVDSSVTAIKIPTNKNPVYQPQKISAAASSKGGVFIDEISICKPPACKLSTWDSFQLCQTLLYLAGFQYVKMVRLVLHGAGVQ